MSKFFIGGREYVKHVGHSASWFIFVESRLRKAGLDRDIGAKDVDEFVPRALEMANEAEVLGDLLGAFLCRPGEVWSPSVAQEIGRHIIHSHLDRKELPVVHQALGEMVVDFFAEGPNSKVFSRSSTSAGTEDRPKT